MNFSTKVILILSLLFVFLALNTFLQAQDTLWTKTYGGSGYDRGYSIKSTSDGGYIIAGNTTSFGLGGWDIYLLKIDSVGNVI